MNKIFLGLIVGFFSYTSMAQNNTYNIIPKPEKLKAQQGKFVFNDRTRIIIPSDASEMYDAAFVLTERFLKASGWQLKVEDASQKKLKASSNAVFFSLNPLVKNKEGYRLKILKDRIEVEASAAAGFFYAMQTVRQLLPPEIENKTPTENIAWTVPCAEIEDFPRYVYRGVLLDMGRHFSHVDALKRYIDQIAFHKINTLQLHLTDDQGWRVEIKKYPKLSEIAAWRNRTNIGRYQPSFVGGLYNQIPPGDLKYNDERHGGFYTQEEIKDLVEYARKRFITIIPEIEMPGHAMAALAAYPEFSCSGGPFQVSEHWGIHHDVFCPKEETFRFLEDVLSEVIELFPSQYIHIGGDEVPKIRWHNCHSCQTKIAELGLKDEHELQSYFISRIEKFVNSKGRRIIGWDEILDGGLAPDATVMSWRGTKGGIAVAQLGHDVIMTPTSHCYFEQYQSKDKNEQQYEPLAGGGSLTLAKVYSFDPTPQELNAQEAKHILGAQANVWGEYTPTDSIIEYMLFPRLAALSEVVWTNKDRKNYDDFKVRLKDGIVKHYDIIGLNYSHTNLKSDKVTSLFNGKNLDGWYTYLAKRGKNDDPLKVFSVQDGLLRVSGEEFGCITTNDEYENYSLEIEFKTGTSSYSPRKGRAFDSGLLIHSIGEDGVYGGVWMQSIECNIIDGGCGDFIVVAKGNEDKFSLTTTVAPPSKPKSKSGGLDYDPDGIETTIHGGERINRIGRDHEWQDVDSFRGENEIEKVHGEWNTIKCVAQGETITIYLNGKLVNKAKAVKPQKGRIQIQSEGAEFFFKRIDLTPL